MLSKPPIISCLGPKCENEDLIEALWECYTRMPKTRVYKNELYCDACGWKVSKGHEPDCQLGRMEQLTTGGSDL